LPGPLIQRQDISNGAVSAQPRDFSKFGGKSRAARVFFYFATALVPVGMPHALGRTPTSWRVVNISRDGTPGTVFAPTRYDTAGASTKTSDLYNFSKNHIVLACETANTWAEVEVT
jgi:hypothetical protein